MTLMITDTLPPRFWLDAPFQQLSEMFNHGAGHHALLLQSTQGLGESYLIRDLAQRILCQSPITHQTDGADQRVVSACNTCHSCELFIANNHPDLHLVAPEKGKSSIGVDAIRALSEILYSHASQGGAKIIQIERLEALTEAAANALLKMLEEPPANTYFLLNTFEPSRILPTIRSRCFVYLLALPERTQSIEWLHDALSNQEPAESKSVSQNRGLESYETAIKLAYGAPINALKILSEATWSARHAFLQAIFDAVTNKQPFLLLTHLKGDDVLPRLEQLSSLLLDVIKLRTFSRNLNNRNLNKEQIKQITEQLINSDSIDLLYLLDDFMSHIELEIHPTFHYADTVLQNLISLRSQLAHNTSFNSELLIADFLMKWQKGLLKSQTFGFTS